jgi:hypothetical protein
VIAYNQIRWEWFSHKKFEHYVCGLIFLEKLMYVYGYKLRNIYVSSIHTGTYPVPVLSFKWSTRASYIWSKQLFNSDTL